jgi:hypothetical protein
VNQNVKMDEPNRGSKCDEETGQYSMEKEFLQSSEIPR